ncbi:MAG: hypothetical protein HY731_14120 [Candidatus Tectomicrobia bacterium]|nr:hypothetical protein [Candidatus Tectomicrobia bacterium]
MRKFLGLFIAFCWISDLMISLPAKAFELPAFQEETAQVAGDLIQVAKGQRPPKPPKPRKPPKPQKPPKKPSKDLREAIAAVDSLTNSP